MMALGAVLIVGGSICDGPAVAGAAPVHETIGEWIEHDALPFSPGSPKDFNSALDKVVDSLGSQVELLGFGEGLHGGEDILTARNHVFQHLVEAHGYSAIALETSFAGAARVNEYVLGLGPASYAALLGSGFGFGELEANHDLVEWMRHYNADAAHQVKLHFYGFDISKGGPDAVLHLALDYLATVDAASARQHRQRIDALLAQASGWDEAWTDSAKSPALAAVGIALRIATEDLITELRTRRPELVARSTTERYLEGLQDALIARQALDLHSALAHTVKEPPHGNGLRGVRDAMMADNLIYIVNREKGRGKVMAFAHNDHVRRGWATLPCCGLKYNGSDTYSWWPAGSQLSDMMGSRYAIIGTGIGTSDTTNGIGPAEPGTLEARLAAVPGPALLIPTHQGKTLSTAQLAALPVRSGSEKNLSYSPLTVQSLTDFDWLLMLDSTQYIRWVPGSSRRAE